MTDPKIKLTPLKLLDEQDIKEWKEIINRWENTSEGIEDEASMQEPEVNTEQELG